MNKFSLITVFIFLTALPAYAQPSEKELDQIRDWFKEVNANVTQYRKVEYPDIKITKEGNSEQYSIEGEGIYRLEKVNMTKFFDDEQLVKIVIELYGDREDLLSDYYFKNGHLFFVDKVRTVYHKPKWVEEFNALERSVVKNRFYFRDDQLIRWINPEIYPVGKMDPSYHKHEAKILNDYKLYYKMD